ncbi:MAG: TIGR01459 family HAD-type hydrolase [Pseudomonadota bacterium]
MREIADLTEIAAGFSAIVLDQFGVLHDGAQAYPGAVETLEAMKARGQRLAVLSNSGKRAAPNVARIAGMGFHPDLFEIVMSSGEALWQDVASGRVSAKRFFPVARQLEDARSWADGLEVEIVESFRQADAVLVMGYPEPLPSGFEDCVFQRNAEGALPVYCTNPDRASPRGHGVVPSCGALAHRMAEAGQEVYFYGKPHVPIFAAMERALDLPSEALLMVGDSLEHDVAGAQAAGWQSLFLRAGLHAKHFVASDDIPGVLSKLAETEAAPLPNFTAFRLAS